MTAACHECVPRALIERSGGPVARKCGVDASLRILNVIR
jgi:hypothetical protein